MRLIQKYLAMCQRSGVTSCCVYARHCLVVPQLIGGDVFQDLPILRRLDRLGQPAVDVVLGDLVSLKGQQPLSYIVADTHCFAPARWSSFVKKSRKIGSRLTKLTHRMKCRDESKLKV